MEKPTMKQRLESLATFIWDSENSKLLGRGAKSWAEIGLFYLVYYACLASFFAATLAVFYETVSDTEPKLLEDSSLLNGNPGLGFRPRVDIDDPKIKAKAMLGKNGAVKDHMDEFLKPYVEEPHGAVDCSGFKKPRGGEKDACAVDYATLTAEGCHPDRDYGFADGTPCVAVKMNKVFGWVPKLWNSETDAKFIKDDWNMTYESHVVPLRCYAKDEDNNQELGKVSYIPQQGYPIYYYPYENQKNYRSPLVFVKFDGAKRGTTHEVECRIYAKNVEYDRTDIQASAQFKLYIDE